MRRNIKTILALAAGGLVLAAATASANTFFANQTGKSCTDCHNPGQEQLGPRGLNNYGSAFKNCGYKDCAGQAAPAATSENNQGIGTFVNNCPNGQTRFVGVRPGRNVHERNVILFLDPGQRLKVAVSQGTTWTGKCGAPPSDNDQYNWVKLDQVL